MFSCSFFDENNDDWFLCYNPGYINIQSKTVNIQLNFPLNEKGVCEQGSNYRFEYENIWTELNTQGFTLRSTFRIGDEVKDGTVEVDFHATEYSGSHYIKVEVPDLLAKGLTDLMNGKYDLEGAVHVQRG